MHLDRVRVTLLTLMVALITLRQDTSIMRLQRLVKECQQDR